MNSFLLGGSDAAVRSLAALGLACALPALADARLALLDTAAAAAASGKARPAAIEFPACLVVTNTQDAGDGSLRAAIECANAHPGLDTITFSIPGDGPHHIGIVTPLPEVTDAVIIDGYSQPGARQNTVVADGNDAVIRIVLDGAEAGFVQPGARIERQDVPARTIVDALVLAADGCRIQGLNIQRFPGVGIAVQSNENLIYGNFIGTDADGRTPAGNSRMGVDIRGGSNNRIGGTEPSEVNIIAYNLDAGVRVGGNPPGLRNSIAGNSIHGNGALGIDLGGDGVTLNDAEDADSGANGLQNFPVLTSARLTETGLVVAGTLNSPDGPFYIEFFANDACDAAEHGEGQRFLGRVRVLPEGSTAGFENTFPGAFNDSTRITATATAIQRLDSSAGAGRPRPAGKLPSGDLLGTSEFARCIPVEIAGPVLENLAATVSDAVDPVIAGHELTYTVTVRNLGEGAAEQPAITGQTVTVALPAAAQFVSASGGVLPIGGLLTFVNVTVPPEGTHLQFSVKYPAPGTNNVVATVTDPGPITADNSATEQTVVVAEPVPVISVADVTFPEGDAGVVDRTVVMRVDPAPADSLTFNYSTASGTAIAGTDFKGVTNGVVFIPAGSTQVPLRVQVIGNTLPEPDKAFALQFAAIPGVELAATFARPSATVTIQNDDLIHHYADLAIQLTGTPDPVTAGSELQCRIAVTNLGPETAPGFFVRETLPPHAVLQGAQPSQGSLRRNGQDLEWTVDAALASGAGAVLTLQLVPDRAGILTNTASVVLLSPSTQPTRVRPQGGASLAEDTGPSDPVVGNNSATLLTTVLGGLTVENLSTNGVVLNRQTGLFEQRLRVRNASADTVAGARVLLRGLAASVVVRNAAGTEDGVPFVDVKRFLAAAEEVELRVEYYVATRVPPALPELEIRSNPTAAPPAGTNAVPSLSARAINGRFLLEFLSAPQRLYAIEYADLQGTNVVSGWKRAVPEVTARANAVQWFDDGPPKTETPPTNRIYRVRVMDASVNNNVPNP